MLIGLNGRLQAGKDTTFSIIRELNDDAERISFADMLKNSAAESIGMSRELLEWLKNEEDFIFTIMGPSDQVNLNQERLDELDQWQMTARQYLQWYGTEGHRVFFGDDIWVDAALPNDLDHSDRFIVVTDMRFPNEVQRVMDLGGVTVKVERDNKTRFAKHDSEQDIDHLMDYFIDNTKGLSELEEEVQKFMRELPHLEGRAKSRRFHTTATNFLEKR